MDEGRLPKEEAELLASSAETMGMVSQDRDSMPAISCTMESQEALLRLQCDPQPRETHRTGSRALPQPHGCPTTDTQNDKPQQRHALELTFILKQ